MPPICSRFSSPALPNSTSTLTIVKTSPFSAPVQLNAPSFVSVCFIHAMIIHSPVPSVHTFHWTIVEMILGPAGAGVVSFNSIVIFAVKIGKYGSHIAQNGQNKKFVYRQENFLLPYFASGFNRRHQLRPSTVATHPPSTPST
jgi:hypothetical protein